MTTFKKWSDGGEIPAYQKTRPSEFENELPGEPLFLRGVQPTMYRGKLWTMRQYAGFGTAKETNQRYLQLLRAGQTGLSMA
ncbi:MAG: methylmalonyl-CoA mutase, partial [Bdellovibrionales bacterium]|nr:methylmalonyl-CoA mutase [Bdellovibrionales bacterium]